MKDGVTGLEKKVPSNVEDEDFETFEKIFDKENNFEPKA